MNYRSGTDGHCFIYFFCIITVTMVFYSNLCFIVNLTPIAVSSQPFRTMFYASMQILCDFILVFFTFPCVYSCCCCCDSPATRLPSPVIQVEEVCDRSRTIPQVLRWVASGCFDSWTDVLRSVVPLHTADKHLICHWWCGPCNCSRADSDRNAAGQVWYGPTEGADFQEVRYQVVKLQNKREKIHQKHKINKLAEAWKTQKHTQTYI